MNTKHTPGVREDRNGQYVPTLDGKDISPTSFDRERALEIAREAAEKGRPRYKEARVRCFGTAESGPFAELEDGRRVYGVCGAAPALLAALRSAQQDLADLGELSAETIAMFAPAIAKATAPSGGTQQPL